MQRASRWAAAQLHCQAAWSAAPEIVHSTPWSAVVRFTHGGRHVFLKALGRNFLHEIPLTLALQHEFPTISPMVISTDAERGWLLMEPGGMRMREHIGDEGLIDSWLRILPAYAALQANMLGRASELLSMGVPDRRVGKASQEFSSLIDRAIRLGRDCDDALSKQEALALRAMASEVQSDLELLSETEIAATIDHGDLHDANVFYREGRPAFFDWGDAGLSFPFFSLRTIEVSIENRLGEDALESARAALQEAYLGPWRARAGPSMTEAETWMEASRRVWAIGSALRWRRAIEVLSPGERRPYAAVLPSLMREVLQARERH